MLHPPDRFERGRIGGQPGDHMPVDVGELVAEEFVINLLGLIDLRDNFGEEAHFFHQLNPLRRSQMKQLGRVALEDDDGPAREELILMQIGLGEAQVRDEMVFSRPAALAGLARGIHHG